MKKIKIIIFKKCNHLNSICVYLCVIISEKNNHLLKFICSKKKTQSGGRAGFVITAISDFFSSKVPKSFGRSPDI